MSAGPFSSICTCEQQRRCPGCRLPLLDRDSTPEDYEAERDAPRPGVWAGEPGADLRKLTQDETDALIRRELFALASAVEVNDVLAAIGGHVDMPPWPEDAHIRPYRSARCQRGGIDSDPLVRILARRAWGDRDRQWCALRGVRKGDALTSFGGAPNTQRAWPGDYVIGEATDDARPGETITNVSRKGDPVRFLVSDRLREPPRYAAYAIGPGEPDLNGDIIEEGEMRRALDEFAKSHAAVSALGFRAWDILLDRDGNVPTIRGIMADMVIVDDHIMPEHAPSQHVPWFGCSSTFRDEPPLAGPAHTPGARIAGTKPKPAVPRWARERRGRPARGPGR